MNLVNMTWNLSILWTANMIDENITLPRLTQQSNKLIADLLKWLGNDGLVDRARQDIVEHNLSIRYFNRCSQPKRIATFDDFMDKFF